MFSCWGVVGVVGGVAAGVCMVLVTGAALVCRSIARSSAVVVHFRMNPCSAMDSIGVLSYGLETCCRSC